MSDVNRLTIGSLRFGPGPNPGALPVAFEATTKAFVPTSIASGLVAQMARESEMAERTKVRIVCAAFKLDDGTILTSVRHDDGRMNIQVVQYRQAWMADQQMSSVLDENGNFMWPKMLEGFVDNLGNFHDRKAALAIAVASGQMRWQKTHPPGELNSTDLY
jgi:hypothetical protein